MDQISSTNPTDAPSAENAGEPRTAAPAGPPEAGRPGFGARGRARRRARFLRKARELAYRDLGGLVFNLHRFGQRNDPLVMAKLTTLGRIDGELRTLEAALQERRPVTVLREAGITACARCAAIHSSEDRFCPNCGLSMGRHADLPIGGAPIAAPAPALPDAPPTQAPAPAPAPAAPAPAAPAMPAPAMPAPAPPPPTSTAAPVGARAPSPPRAVTAEPAAPEPAAAEHTAPNLAEQGAPTQPDGPEQAPEEIEATAILRPPTAAP